MEKTHCMSKAVCLTCKSTSLRPPLSLVNRRVAKFIFAFLPFHTKSHIFLCASSSSLGLYSLITLSLYTNSDSMSALTTSILPVNVRSCNLHCSITQSILSITGARLVAAMPASCTLIPRE